MTELLNSSKLKTTGAQTRIGLWRSEGLMITYSLKKMSKIKVKLYTAFIDFRKFFDCTNRSSLMYKIQKCGITGQIYNVIKGA